MGVAVEAMNAAQTKVKHGSEGKETKSVQPKDDLKFRRRWATLAVLSVSLLIINIDDTVVNIAIPTLQRALGASVSELQWIVTAYILVFAGLLLTMGSLGDRFGRKRALQVGLGIFGVASVFAAYSPGALPMIASRAVMGLGAALIMPSTLSVIIDVFPRGERAKAIGIWTGVASLGIPLGPILGGWLLQTTWWGSIFLVNVPIVLVALVGGLVLVPESRHPAPPRIDLAGMGMSTAALASLLYGIIGIPQQGWSDPAILASFAAAVVLGAAFVRHERRSDHPMLDLNLFRDRRLSSGAAAIVIMFLAFAGLAFSAVQYLQIVGGYGPLETGVLLLPLVLAVMVGAGGSSKLVARMGSGRAIGTALLVLAGGLVLVSRFDAATAFWVVALSFVPVGFGIGSAMAPSTAAIMEAVPKDDAGVGSSLNDVARQVGAALGVSLLGSLLSWVYSAKMAGPVSGLPPGLAAIAQNSVGGAAQVAALLGSAGQAFLTGAFGAFVAGFGVMSLAAAAVAVLGAVVVVRFMPRAAAQTAAERDLGTSDPADSTDAPSRSESEIVSP